MQFPKFTLKLFSKPEAWFAMGGVLTLLGAIIFSSLLLIRDHQIYHEQAHPDEIHTAARQEPSCNNLSGIERIHCYATESEAHQHANSADNLARMDVNAQRRMAFWTAAIGVVGIFSLPLSLIAIGLLVLTLRDTRRIAKVESGGTVTPVKARTGHNDIAYFTSITVKKGGAGTVTNIYFDGEVEILFSRTIADKSGNRKEKIIYPDRSTVVDFVTDGEFDLVLGVNEHTHRIVQSTFDAQTWPFMRITGHIFFTDAFGDKQWFKIYLAGSLDNNLSGELHRPRKTPPVMT